MKRLWLGIALFGFAPSSFAKDYNGFWRQDGIESPCELTIEADEKRPNQQNITLSRVRLLDAPAAGEHKIDIPSPGQTETKTKKRPLTRVSPKLPFEEIHLTLSGDSGELNIAGWFDAPQPLRQKPKRVDDDLLQRVCFESPEERATKIQVCNYPEMFTLFVPGSGTSSPVELRAIRTNKLAPRAKEAAVTLTLEKAIAIALVNNYTLRGERQMAIQKWKAADVANLRRWAPHMSVKTALNITYWSTAAWLDYMSGDLLGGWFPHDGLEGASTASSLFPWAFPARHKRAGMASQDRHHARLDYIAMQAETTMDLQLATINFLATKKIIDNLTELKGTADKVIGFAKTLPPVYIDSLGLALNTVERALLDQEITLREQRVDLSRKLGFWDALHVKNITLGKETKEVAEIDELPDDESEYYAERGRKNSLEVKSLKFLHAAKGLDIERIGLSFLDVIAEDEFGPSLKPRLQEAVSARAKVGILIEAMYREIGYNASLWGKWRMQYLEKYRLAEAGRQAAKSRLDRILADLERESAEGLHKEGRSHHEPAIISKAIDDQIPVLVALYETEARVKIAQSKLDRIALEGAYAGIYPSLAELPGKAEAGEDIAPPRETYQPGCWDGMSWLWSTFSCAPHKVKED